jgi:ABC-2 type transport system permease protein
MSVYRRAYQPYTGVLTSEPSRLLVVLRYALAELLGSRMLMAFLFVSCIPVLAAAAIIYLAHNPAARALIGLAKLDNFLRIDAEFFRQALSTQCFFGFVLSAWVGPGLIAGDLANGALPLYLSRPISRFAYVVGKALVLVVLLSSMTWVPSLLLYLLNAALADDGWGASHLRIAAAAFAGGLGWIVVTALFALSLSAWIRWRLAASSMMFGIYFVSAGLGEAVAVMLRVAWGRIFSLGHLFEVVLAHLFGVSHHDHGVSPLAACLTLSGLCAFSVFVIHWRLRAREVVR